MPWQVKKNQNYFHFVCCVCFIYCFYLLYVNTLSIGASAASLTYPLDVIRVRQATFNDIKGPIDAIKRIHGESGIHGFFRGWVPTVMSLGPFIACNFATFDYLKSNFIKDGDTKNANSFLVLALGAGSGLFAQSICYPLDTVRRNMQVYYTIRLFSLFFI